jgi:hypothetical protein
LIQSVAKQALDSHKNCMLRIPATHFLCQGFNIPEPSGREIWWARTSTQRLQPPQQTQTASIGHGGLHLLA